MFKIVDSFIKKETHSYEHEILSFSLILLKNCFKKKMKEEKQNKRSKKKSETNFN